LREESVSVGDRGDRFSPLKLRDNFAVKRIDPSFSVNGLWSVTFLVRQNNGQILR